MQVFTITQYHYHQSDTASTHKKMVLRLTMCQLADSSAIVSNVAQVADLSQNLGQKSAATI